MRFKKLDDVYTYMPVPLRPGIERKTDYLWVRIGKCSAAAEPTAKAGASPTTTAASRKLPLANCVIDADVKVGRRSDGQYEVQEIVSAYSGPSAGRCPHGEADHFRQRQCWQLEIRDAGGKVTEHRTLRQPRFEMVVQANQFPIRFRHHSVTEYHSETVTVGLSPDGKVQFTRERN